MTLWFRPMPQGIRGFRARRCERCWMDERLCICELLPRIETRTRVVVVMQWKESCRSSNTGRLAHLVLSNSEVRLRGSPQRPLDLSGIASEGGRACVLVPAGDATVLTPEIGEHGPQTLVVPDGSWRQARRIWKHEEALAGLQKVRLPPGPPSVYRLRRARETDQLCTYESIARALGVLEGSRVEARMMPPFVAMVERTLASRGRSP